MDLFENPFYILGASTRDNRHRLAELADEQSLLYDSTESLDARSLLTNPRKRISAELTWLPGLSPAKAQDALSTIQSSPEIAIQMKSLNDLSRLNILLAGLKRLPSDHADNQISQWIVSLANTFEQIRPEQARKLLNEERAVSGFSEISELTEIESQLTELRRYCKNLINTYLDTLGSKQLVEIVTHAIETSTNDGEKHAPILLDDLIDSYELGVQGVLEKGESNINKTIEKISSLLSSIQCPKCNQVQAESSECSSCGVIFNKYIENNGGDLSISDNRLSPDINQLIRVTKNWDFIAQPIQVSNKSRGLPHEPSIRIASLVRGLAITLFNEHGKLDFSRELTLMLKEVFAEVVEVTEKTQEDINTLDEIVAQREELLKQADVQSEKWKREITYEADVGIVFKNKLRIAPEGIYWKNKQINLDSVTGARWGGIRQSVNGVSTGITYTISISSKTQVIHLELKKQEIFSNFIDRLWRSVGVRLLTEYIEGLQEGKRYSFSSAVVSDKGVELELTKLFASNERVFCRWSELQVWTADGAFCIGSKNNKKLAVELTYLSHDNVHVLEAMIRMLFENGGSSLSSLLRG
ncbi:hypothetical protein [Methylophaga sp.]|uniref:hypothetical protein n=1 Tax=Methylophaga sp. TaxID=2024840 RepID=UPI003A9051CE